MRLFIAILQEKGRLIVAMGREMRRERGAMDVGGILLMGIGMVFLAVGFIMFPIVTTSTDSLLAYQYSGLSSITDASFTGFTAVIGITPLLVLVGYLSATVFAMFLGVKVMRGGASARLDLGNMLMLGISLIFIAIALIILPVTLDGISSVVAHKVTVSESDSANTAVGATTANVTLDQTLFNNDTAEVVSVSSNISGDGTVTAVSYADPLLLVGSLTANTTRTVTTEYYYADSLAQYTGAYPILLVTPLLILISFISGAVLSGFMGFKSITRG